MVSETSSVPLASPPSQVGLVVFELTGEEHGDEDFVDSTLDENDGDKTKNGVSDIPEFEEPLEKKKNCVGG